MYVYVVTRMVCEVGRCAGEGSERGVEQGVAAGDKQPTTVSDNVSTCLCSRGKGRSAPCDALQRVGVRVELVVCQVAGLVAVAGVHVQDWQCVTEEARATSL